MDARITKADAALLMSFPTSRAAPGKPAGTREAALAVSLASAFGGVAEVMRRIAAWPGRQRAIAQLHSLTDRQLDDIGLSRADIAKVVERNARRAG